MMAKIKNNKNLLYFLSIILVSFSCLALPLSCAKASAFFSDDFSASTNNWTPSSGAWLSESGKYKHKEIGVNYDGSSKILYSNDFSGSVPSTTISSTPVSDTFTQADGADANWTVKAGTFGVVGNEYHLTSGTWTMTLASSTGSDAWTDYRLTTSVKREGAADAYGYSLIYFRMNPTSKNGYALLVRQTGVAELYKVSNGGSGSSLSASASIAKDNNYHTVIITAIGSAIKVYIDKDESSAPDIYFVDSTYTTGTVGLGTNSWASDFDNVKVDLLNVSSLWNNVGSSSRFYTNSGKYVAPGTSGVRTMSLLSDTASSSWSNYRFTTKYTRNAVTGTVGGAVVWFRTTLLSTTTYNSYALVFGNDGNLILYKVPTSWSGATQIGRSGKITQDNTEHTAIIRVVGDTVRVWVDIAETQIPTLEYKGLTDYTTGTVGLGNYAVTSAGLTSVFDDFEVKNLLNVSAAPSHLYSDVTSSSTITFTSSASLDNLSITITNPNGTSWTLSNPAGCSGNRTCAITFPTSFSGANLSVLGTYKVVATNGDDSSTSLFEVREKPILSFADLTDVHIGVLSSTNTTQLNKFISDVNGQKFFPLPNFAVVTGDLTDLGTTAQMSAVKSALDGLSVAYYPILGNHDTEYQETGNDRGHIWTNVFGSNRITYSWTIGDYLFLGMAVNDAYNGAYLSLCDTDNKSWLTSILAANPNKYVILFDHYSLLPVRDSGSAAGFWQGNSGSCSTGVRSLLEAHNKTIAQFAGHSHLNGSANSNGIYYFQTSGFVANGEYRYVEVYGDRVESRIIKTRDYFDNYISDNSYYGGYDWSPSVDSSHSSTTYSYGLPLERQFKINYSSSTDVIDILDGLTTGGSTAWRDYAVQANVIPNSESNSEQGFYGENIAGLAFRYQNNNNYYSAMLDSASDLVRLYKKENGVVSEIASSSAVIATSTQYLLKVEAQGSGIKVYLDNTLKINTTDSTLSSGKIGLRTYLASTDYDDVSVTDLAGPAHFELISPASNGVVGRNPSFSWEASSDAESGLSKYQLYIDGSLDTDNISPSATSASSTAHLADGQHAWYVAAVDNSGNISTSTSSYSFNIRVDSPTPSNSQETTPTNAHYSSSVISASNLLVPPSALASKLTLNQGSAVTKNRLVTLEIPTVPNASKISISLNKNFIGASKEPYAKVKKIDICSKTCSPGKKNVYIKLFSSSGEVSPIITASIDYQPKASAVSSVATFDQNLSLGSSSHQVQALQQFLNAKGFFVAKSGSGSSGKETEKFGPATRAALIRFQKANNIKPANGLLGPQTRLKINGQIQK